MSKSVCTYKSYINIDMWNKKYGASIKLSSSADTSFIRVDFDLNGQLQGHKAKAVSHGRKILAVTADGIFGVGVRGIRR